MLLGTPSIFGSSAGDGGLSAPLAWLAISWVRRSAASGNVAHAARVDLTHDFHQDLEVKPVENLGRVLGTHVFIHGDQALEAARLGFIFFLQGGVDLRLGGLEFVEPRLQALFRRLEKALAQIEFARARVKFLAPLLQPLQDGPLRRRYRARR